MIKFDHLSKSYQKRYHKAIKKRFADLNQFEIFQSIRSIFSIQFWMVLDFIEFGQASYTFAWKWTNQA